MQMSFQTTFNNQNFIERYIIKKKNKNKQMKPNMKSIEYWIYSTKNLLLGDVKDRFC